MRRMQITLDKTRTLRAACGRLAARRGSTLILVVATLALLAVLTVAYVSIGGGDRRAARTTTLGAEVDRQAEHVAEYLAGIVADDALSVYFQGFDFDGNPIIRTEAVDVPLTDPNRTFDGSAASPATPEPQDNFFGLAFTPTGSLPPLPPDVDASDPIDDPNLFDFGGSQELRPFEPSDPFLAASEPTFLREATGSFSDPAYLDRRDWAKISNISPNGLFVNLFQLRGNFDASPGLNAGDMSDPSVMFLLERDPSGPSTIATTTTTLSYGGTAADPAIPAHYDSHLVELFRPAGAGGFGPADAENLLYRYADADGDGFFDSAWQELVDVTPSNGPRYVVPQEGQLRWFVAARIVDLSGRVNVNTARALQRFDGTSSDYVGAPNNANRLGASPADVDLLRLLTMEPQWGMYGELYDSAPQPSAGGSVQDYSDYNDYAAVASPIGELGYDALRFALEGFEPPTAGPLAGALPLLTADTRRSEYESERFAGQGYRLTTGIGVERQYGFGLEDLRDLLTYEGLNNPDSLSRLEQTTGGRFAGEETFSPLRENRSLQWERAAPQDPTDEEPLSLRHTSIRRQLTTLSGAILRTPTQIVLPPAPTGSEVFRGLSRLPENGIALSPDDDNPSIMQDGNELLFRAAPRELPTTTPADEDEARRERNAHPLFRMYANALMPAASEVGGWVEPEWLSTFYGSDPLSGNSDRLFALRTAAHLTANMIDAYDADDIPSAFTLLVDPNRRADVSSNPDVFPWWNDVTGIGSGTTPQSESGRLDLGESRLPSGIASSAPIWAMNVYGLEVHPFITQVSLYNVFSDSVPPDGDQEYMGPGTGGGTGLGTSGGSSNPITIDFATDPGGNSDFVGQVFAVQLTNPYTTDIVVRGNQYFIRFGHLGGFASADLPDGLEVPSGTTIRGGESVVLYATTDDFEGRAASAAPSFSTVSAAAVTSWFERHFTVTSSNPLTGAATPPVRITNGLMGIDDFLAGPVASIGGEEGLANRDVTLWARLNRANGTGVAETVDVMLDRLSDSVKEDVRPTLDRRPPSIEIDVDVTVAGPDTTGNPADAIDNTGFSIVTWGTIARPTGMVEAPRGALPAYVLEVPSSEEMAFTSLNAVETDGLTLPSALSTGFTLNRGQFVGGGKLDSAERFLSDIFGGGGSTGATAQIRTDIGRPAIESSHDLRNIIEAADHPDGIDFEDDLLVNPFRNDNQGRLSSGAAMLRPGDFLGVPAVGPVQLPRFDGGSADPEVLSWLTTGELLTLALGYEVAPPATADGASPSVPENTDDLLDRGHLSFDLPAPFVDVNGSGVFESDEDERRGLGVPHAMAVLSSITTIGARVDAQTPIAGLVNLNTATEAAMTVLPGLSPTADSLLLTPDAAWIEDGSNFLHDHRSDVGAGIRSYRDKSAVRPRLLAASDAANQAVPFFDTAVSWGDLDPTDIAGRFARTGYEAIRELPGFLSAGELMAVDTPFVAGGGGIGGTFYPQPLLMRRLAVDNSSLAVDGMDPVRYTSDGAVDQATGTPNFEDDGIADDYDEQLALYNGVANAVAVRSDVYAIWFVLHGYARDDVEGLRPQDPMVPSVARRYLMVIDRSNVRRAGDRPKVLLFDEVPL